MPFDPFFSSAHKKHYIENPEATALADKLMAMSISERCKVIDGWWSSGGFTLIQRMAVKRVRFINHGRTWARIHRDIERKSEIATKELKQGKRVLRVLSNAQQYNTTPGAVCNKQTHGFGAR